MRLSSRKAAALLLMIAVAGSVGLVEVGPGADGAAAPQTRTREAPTLGRRPLPVPTSAANHGRTAAQPRQKPGSGKRTSTPEDLAAGQLLVATRQLASPVFAGTVVLLLEVENSGALGVILNRPMNATLASVFPSATELREREDRVLLGGPVSLTTMLYLVRTTDDFPDSHPLVDGVRMSGSDRALAHALETDLPTSRLRAFMGYAGWGPGQLDGEVLRGDWFVTPADAALIFDVTAERLWKKLIRKHEAVQVKRVWPAPKRT